MELALSLGDTPKPFSLLDHHKQQKMKDLGFCMGLGNNMMRDKVDDKINCSSSSDLSPPPPPPQPSPSPSPPLQLELLPFSPVLRSPPPPPSASHHRSFPWLSKNCKITSFVDNILFHFYH